MKNKILKCFAITLSITMLSVTAFGVEKNTNDSIYAVNAERIAASVKRATLNESNISVDANTIMPIYQASIYDFAEKGEFSIEPMNFEDGQLYISDAVNNSGSFAGTIMFTVDGKFPDIHMYALQTNKALSVDFRLNSNRINTLMARKNMNKKAMETDAKYVSIEGLGFVYYIDDGEEEILIAAGPKGVNGDFFNEENGGIIVVNEEFKAKADAELEEAKKRQAYLESLAPGENPETGGGISVFVVDNTPYLETEQNSATEHKLNPNTGR